MQQEQNQAHPVAVAQEFMKRAELKGGEVEMYAQTFNYLAQILQGELVVSPKEHLEESKDKQEKLEKEVKDLHVELDVAYARLGEPLCVAAEVAALKESPEKAVEADPALDVEEAVAVEADPVLDAATDAVPDEEVVLGERDDATPDEAELEAVL